MDYLNALETAEIWGVSLQTVLKYCHEGQIQGAYKEGKEWHIPEDAKLPIKRRYNKKRNFTFIDLFCGIGGFHQAMNDLGGTCVFACDINAQCREVYKKNFCTGNEFPVMGDIRDAIKKNAIPEFDVLCGGFPCQTFSKAGLQNGFRVVQNKQGETDDRGQLFYRIIDILKQHTECKYIVLENVRNLADKKENWEVICSELKALDFIITEEPIIASPHMFGIPQVRERVFILGIKKDAIDKRKKLPKGYLTPELLHIEKYKQPITEDHNCLSSVLEDKVDDKYIIPEDKEEIIGIWEEFKNNVHGLLSPFWLHKAGVGIYNRDEYYEDPDIGYQEMPEWKQNMVMKSRRVYEQNYKFIDSWVVRHDMLNRSLLHQKLEWNVGSDYESMKDCIIQIRQSGVRVKRPNFFPSLVVMRNTPIIWDKEKNHYRYITPREAAKLQSFNGNFKFSDIDSVSYEQLGNSVNVKLVKMFANELFKLGVWQKNDTDYVQIRFVWG